MDTKTIGAVILAGAIGVGAGSLDLSAAQVITVDDDGQPKQEIPVVIEATQTSTVFSGTISQLDAQILIVDRYIDRAQSELDKLNTEKTRLKALRAEVQVELDKLPNR